MWRGHADPWSGIAWCHSTRGVRTRAEDSSALIDMLTKKTISRIRQKFSLLQRRISAIRDLPGFKDYRYRLVYFPRSSPQKRRLQPAKKTVSDVKSVAVSSVALAPVATRRNIRGLNDAAPSDRSSASDRITASVAGDLRASCGSEAVWPFTLRSRSWHRRSEPHRQRLICPKQSYKLPSPSRYSQRGTVLRDRAPKYRHADSC
jgi:hypothetical protein